jgi:hypothetical protein
MVLVTKKRIQPLPTYLNNELNKRSPRLNNHIRRHATGKMHYYLFSGEFALNDKAELLEIRCNIAKAMNDLYGDDYEDDWDCD